MAYFILKYQNVIKWHTLYYNVIKFDKMAYFILKYQNVIK